MDLYEALKSGTSADELVATFTKELEAAAAKLKEEAKQITEYRKCLAEAIYNYISALTGSKTLNFTIADIEKELKGIEKELDPVLTLLSGFIPAKKEDYKFFKNENKAEEDDDILAQFVKMLR